MPAEASGSGTGPRKGRADAEDDHSGNPAGAASPSTDDRRSPRAITTPGVITSDRITDETMIPSNVERSRTESRQDNNSADDPAKQLLDDKISIRKKLKMLNQMATIKDNGTVVVDIPSILETTQLDVGGEDGYGDVAVEEATVGAHIPYYCPPLQIVMLIAGTQGDVEVFAAVGKRLQDYGHRVRLATHANFKEFVLSAGLEYFPLGGDPITLAKHMVDNRFLPSNRSSIAFETAQIKELIYSILPACKDPDPDTGVPFKSDAIIANPHAYGHTDVAEALQLPIHIFSTMPCTPTSEFPHPLKFEKQPANYFDSYQNVYSMISLGTRKILNDFRKKKCKLRPVPIDHIGDIPHGYIWSPHLVPKALDWGPKIDVVGSVILDHDPNYTPPQSLLEWLESGEKPIYIYLHVLERGNITAIIVKALEMTGQRGIIRRGTTLAEPKDFVYLLDYCPHAWLFPQCKAVVHHGGAGITSAGLRAACPTSIVHLFGDRSFWGDLVHTKELGPAPIPVHQFSLQKFVDAIEFMMKSQVIEKVMKLAKAMETEDGAQGAVTAFIKHLPRKTIDEVGEPSPRVPVRCCCV